MSKQPNIGIVGWSTGEGSFGTTKSYLHFLSFFGNVRILTPRADIDEDLDLVVMPGGKDTVPFFYGQVPGYYNSDPDQFKEHFAHVNLHQYIDAGIPIFGICLGFQQLVTHFGGELLQNIDLEEHGMSGLGDKPRSELTNELEFTPKYHNLAISLSKKKLKVCSLHHQGVEYVKDDPNHGVPECLDVIAYTSDGIVEFIRHKELPIAGCQSHPEEDWSILSRRLIKDLLKLSPNVQKEHERSIEEN